MMRTRSWIAICLWGVLALVACDTRSLRGRVETSRDGKTYLSIDDDNGGACPIYVDGARWRHRIGQVAPITAGAHTVTFACGSVQHGAQYGIDVRRGTILHFDYWGP